VLSTHARNNSGIQFWCLTFSHVTFFILSYIYIYVILVKLSNFCQTIWAVLLLSETYGHRLAKIKKVHALTNEGIVRFMNYCFGGPHSSS
jgi:hypothetical protein